MRRLQTIISNCAARRQSNMHDGRPALQLVMPIMMEQIRRSNGNACRRCFDRGEGDVIVNDVVRQKNLLPASTAHIQRREIIERARGPDSCEQPVVLFVPKPVLFVRRALFLTF